MNDFKRDTRKEDYINRKPKPIGYTIHINEPKCFVPKGDINNILMEAIAIKVKEVEDSLFKQLYETYKESNVSEIYVIDESEFRKFLEKYLPIYYKEKEEEKWKVRIY